jgi:hypothetical protein
MKSEAVVQPVQPENSKHGNWDTDQNIEKILHRIHDKHREFEASPL